MAYGCGPSGSTQASQKGSFECRVWGLTCASHSQGKVQRKHPRPESGFSQADRLEFI